MTTQECNCTYCRLDITNEQRDKMSTKFIEAVLFLFLLQVDGTILNDSNIEIFGIISKDFATHTSHYEMNSDDYRNILNDLAFCFEEPFDFYKCMLEMSELMLAAHSALNQDTATVSTPILSKIITPLIFLKYFQTRELPDDVKQIIAKVEEAKSVSSVIH